jgi:hypothetical protein
VFSLAYCVLFFLLEVLCFQFVSIENAM